MFKDLFNTFESKVNINKLLFIISIMVYIILSLSRLYNHIPICDEIHAWNISAYLNLHEIFDLMKYEGHLFIWYLLIMPFAKNGLFFPYSMQLINWGFMFAAILVMWKYAPFNSWTKSFITFSLPVNIFSLYARCYSVGLFLLFCICALYPKRLKHPYIYALLIVLTANTSVMALVGAFALGILFFFDLHKAEAQFLISKREVFIIFSIFWTGALLVAMQIFGCIVPRYARSWSQFRFYYFYLGRDFYLPRTLAVICHGILLISSVNFFKKNISIAIFLLFCNAFLVTIFLKIYYGEAWHYVFLFVYLIIAVWLYCSEYELTSVFQKLYKNLFMIFCFLLMFFPSQLIFPHGGLYSNFKDYIIKNQQVFQGKKIFFSSVYLADKEILPYIEKYKFDIYDSFGNSLRSYDTYYARWHYNVARYDFNKIHEIIKNDDYAFIILVDNYVMQKVRQGDTGGLKLEVYDSVYPAMIFKAYP